MSDCSDCRHRQRPINMFLKGSIHMWRRSWLESIRLLKIKNVMTRSMKNVRWHFLSFFKKHAKKKKVKFHLLLSKSKDNKQWACCGSRVFETISEVSRCIWRENVSLPPAAIHAHFDGKKWLVMSWNGKRTVSFQRIVNQAFCHRPTLGQSKEMGLRENQHKCS